MRVLIAGGGTGGHIYPGIAIAQKCSKQNILVDYACTERKIDEQILSEHKSLLGNVIVQPITPASLHPAKFIKFLYNFAKSRKLIKHYLQQHNDIQAIIGLGGFGSVAAIIEGQKQGIKTAILNPDIVPGKANRFCQKYADKIFVQWHDTQIYFGKSVEVIGVPIREEICNLQDKQKRNEYRTLAKSKLALIDNRKVLVIVGGSSGAQSLNLSAGKVIKDMFRDERINEKWQIIHVTGESDFYNVKEMYDEINGINAKILKFCQQMELIWSVADLAICRAGAITIAELLASKVPAIFLPYPFHHDNHQRKNAQMMAKTGTGKIVIDDGQGGSQTQNELKKTLQFLLACEEKLSQMKLKFANTENKAADRIVRWIINE